MIELENTPNDLLSERIRRSLSDDIASGALAAGTPLDEQQLANRFSASRTPVREALRQMAASGLVEMRARKGVRVAQMSAERIMSLFELMAEFESMCVRLATYRMTPFERSRLMALHEQSAMLEDAPGIQVDAYDVVNREFHETIYRATRNEVLVEQVLLVRSRLDAFRKAQLRDDGRVAKSRAEHGSILDAIAQRDGELAAGRMLSHMNNAAAIVERHLARQPGE